MSSSFPLDDYLRRIGFQGTPLADETTLQALHHLQVFSLPFENLNTLSGLPVLLDQESLCHKLLHNQRGGYCFELNGLFLLALEHLGFRTRSLSARVALREGVYGPRSHQITLIEIKGRHWLADAGFGGNGLIDPLPFEMDQERDQTQDIFRLLPDATYGYRLEHRLPGGWRTLYAFSLEPATAADFNLMNYFISTSPESMFTRMPICSRPVGKLRYILYGNSLKIRGSGETQTLPVETSAQLEEMMRTRFGVEWPGNRPLPDPIAPPPGTRSIE